MADVNASIVPATPGTSLQGEGNAEYDVRTSGSIVDEHLPSTNGGGTASLEYRMRAIDGTLSSFVYWTSDTIDNTGTDYGGPGPISDVVVVSTRTATNGS